MNMDILDAQALIDGKATVKSRLRVIAEGSLPEIILSEDNSIVNWLYKDTRYLENEGFIGQFIARTLDGKLQNISDDFNIENRKIELFMGITRSGMEGSLLSTEDLDEIITESGDNIISEGSEGSQTSWYSLGTFIVDKPKDNEVKDNTSFTSMDYTSLFNTTFNPDYVDSTYVKSFNEKLDDGETVTALWLLQYVCKQVGVQLGSQTFTNYDFVIDSNQFDSTANNRDVVKAIAKLAFSWARIGWDDKLYIDFEQGDPEQIVSVDVITPDEYYNLTTQKNNYGPINKIVIGSSVVEGMNAYIEDSASITANGLHELHVYDNPLLYSLESLEDIKNSASSLLGLEYTPAEMQTVGHAWLRGDELVKIVDMEGNYKYTYPFNREIEYFGHIKTKLNAYAQTDTEQVYTYDGEESSSTFTKVTKVRLDRDEQQLEVYMEKTDDNGSDITQLALGLNGLDLRVQSTEGDISDIQGDIVDLQNQIDGAIDFFTGSAMPTLNNYPANEWTTDADKNNHLGDIYTIVDGGQQGASYRFVKDGNVYKWIEISDSEISALRQELADFEAQVAATYATQSSLTTTATEIRGEVTSTETRVIAYTDTKSTTAENNAKTYAAGVANTAQSNAESYANGVASTAETNAKDYADGIETSLSADIDDAEQNAKDYANDINSTTNDSLNSLSGTVDSLNTDLITAQGNIDNLTANQENFATKVSLQTLTNTVTTLQTNTYTKTEINTKLTDGSVTKVDTTTGFTMDATGFHVDKTGAETSSTLDEKGLSVKDSSDNDVSYVGYVDSDKISDNPNLAAYEGQTVTYQENAIINHYLQVPNSRIEEYSGGTGVFFTG